VDFLVDPWSQDLLDWGPVPVRIALGVIFVDAGFGKWHRGISGTGDWFAGLGISFPQAQARLVASVELVGGLLLILGLFTHWVAIPLAANMLVATYISKVKLRLPFQGGEVQGYELNVILLAAAVTIVIGGAGTLSLDELLA
jgi:putative oxidoreductase